MRAAFPDSEGEEIPCVIDQVVCGPPGAAGIADVVERREKCIPGPAGHCAPTTYTKVLKPSEGMPGAMAVGQDPEKGGRREPSTHEVTGPRP